jgi:16S rRNA (adenine1518-N6/adenine1519-N6)-dimethyltransferase
MNVRAKKNLGQHFLTDRNIARDIVNNLKANGIGKVLEIGPGMGVLTEYLLENSAFQTSVVEIDRESVAYLQQHFPQLSDRIIEGDFLKLDLQKIFSSEPFAIIGNFPYNISSQIFFKVIDNKNLVTEVVCMLQKEVAERISSGPGSKIYGILSVLLQAWFDIDYLFTVDEHVFNPPPKVKSAVIRIKRNNVVNLGCNEKLFKEIVKQSFNQRRKMLRNTLKAFTPRFDEIDTAILTNRPEQLSVKEFVELTNIIDELRKS